MSRLPKGRIGLTIKGHPSLKKMGEALVTWNELLEAVGSDVGVDADWRIESFFRRGDEFTVRVRGIEKSAAPVPKEPTTP